MLLDQKHLFLMEQVYKRLFIKNIIMFTRVGNRLISYYLPCTSIYYERVFKYIYFYFSKIVMVISFKVTLKTLLLLLLLGDILQTIA